MERKSLIIIPISKILYRYGFSAPLGYMFTNHLSFVHGVFSTELTTSLVSEYNYFIVELNWVTEFWEFKLIVDFIKKVNPKNRILFGGLFAQLHYRKIFQSTDVDYFIRGDNELPLQLFLQGESLNSIPNFVTRKLTKDITYFFPSSELALIDYSIDWFPSYNELLSQAKNNKPIINRYNNMTTEIYKDQCTRDELFYSFPIIISTKKCTVAHKGCNYCMGSRSFDFQGIASYDDNMLKTILSKIEKKKGAIYQSISLYILNDILEYDFTGTSFSLEVFIEYDGPMSGPKRIEKLKKLLHAFQAGICRIPASSIGLHEKSRDLNYKELIKEVETEQHNLKYLFYESEKETSKIKDIPDRNKEFTLDNFDCRGKLTFEKYASFSQAITTSIDLYYANQIDEQFKLNSILKSPI